MIDLQEKYNLNLRKQLKEENNYRSIMEVPSLKKIILNVGIPAIWQDEKILNDIKSGLDIISLQSPVFCLSKKSISNFKLRQGMKIGCLVTLRRKKMYIFFTKLIDYVFSQLRDFKGFSVKSFDGKGNFTVGVSDYTIFPELASHSISNKFWGLSITIVTNAKNNYSAFKLLEKFNFPFRDKIEIN
jgi:large subunit ribosomal protein L5